MYTDLISNVCHATSRYKPKFSLNKCCKAVISGIYVSPWLLKDVYVMPFIHTPYDYTPQHSLRGLTTESAPKVAYRLLFGAKMTEIIHYHLDFITR